MKPFDASYRDKHTHENLAARSYSFDGFKEEHHLSERDLVTAVAMQLAVSISDQLSIAYKVSPRQ